MIKKEALLNRLTRIAKDIDNCGHTDQCASRRALGIDEKYCDCGKLEAEGGIWELIEMVKDFE